MYLCDSEDGLISGGLTGRTCGPVDWLDTCRIELMDSSSEPPWALCREDEEAARASRSKLTDFESCRGEDMPAAPAVTCSQSTAIAKNNGELSRNRDMQEQKILTGKMAAVPSGSITRRYVLE
jgi:hypothetical protein